MTIKNSDLNAYINNYFQAFAGYPTAYAEFCHIDLLN